MVVREFQRLAGGAWAGLFSFSPSRVYIEMGLGRVLMFKNFPRQPKSHFWTLSKIPGVKFEFKSKLGVFAA